jgi:hypothetical protein
MTTRRALLTGGVLPLLMLLACSSDDGPKPDQSRDQAMKTDLKALDAPALDVPVSVDRRRDAAVLPDHPRADADQRPLITNEYPCKGSEGTVVPAKNELGHFAAARLTPTSYPFTVATVRYELNGEASGCTNLLGHKVMVFVAETSTPPATPTGVVTIPVPAATSAGPHRVLEQALPSPITLTSGQHLFVAVEMTGDSSGTLCLVACDGSGIADRNWWSNAVAPPYPWTTLASFGITANLKIDALGP